MILPMDPQLNEKINQLEAKINAIYISVEKTRKYFLVSMVVTLALVILPAIGLVFAIPAFMNNYVGQIQELGL